MLQEEVPVHPTESLSASSLWFSSKTNPRRPQDLSRSVEMPRPVAALLRLQQVEAGEETWVFRSWKPRRKGTQLQQRQCQGTT